MQQNDVVNKVRPFIKEIVESQNLNLFDLEYVKEDGNYFLRVSIEKDDGTMDFDTAEVVSNLLSAKLDELDPIDHEYILDVCSPGAERPLRNKSEYLASLNQYVSVYLNDLEKPTYTGYILEVNDNDMTLSISDKGRAKKVVVNLNEIKKAHIAIKF